MAVTVNNQGGSKYEPPPSGSNVARCIWLIDIGTQHNPQFNKQQRKMRLGFELPLEMREFGKEGEKRSEPVVITKEFTSILGDKSNLSKFLIGWRGRPFAPEEEAGFVMSKILGQECLLNIVHESKQGGGVNAIIHAAQKLPKGMTCPPQILPTINLSLDEDFSIEDWTRVPGWIREGTQRMAGIIKSPEYLALKKAGVIPATEGNGATGNETGDDDFLVGDDAGGDDDIPF